MIVTKEDLERAISDSLREAYSVQGNRNLLLVRSHFSKTASAKLLLELNIVAAGIRASSLLEFYSYHATPILSSVVDRLVSYLGESLRALGILTIALDTSPILVNRNILYGRIRTLSSPPIMLDVHSSRTAIDATMSLGPMLFTILKQIFDEYITIVWLSCADKSTVHLDMNLSVERLKNVGLCGFAGWILEYPVIYCTGESSKNCLSMTPLTLHTFDFELSSLGHSRFSFSSPSMFENQSVSFLIQSSVEHFTALLQKRVVECKIFGSIVDFQYSPSNVTLRAIAL